MLEIKNMERKQRIEEFIDKEHREAASEYYEIYDKILTAHDLKEQMELSIKKDPLFFDPYLVLANYYRDEGKFERAKKIRELAFQKAMLRVVNNEGKFPKIMEWVWLENRHIIRAIYQGGLMRWKDGKIEEALEIFRNLLKSNPTDNIAARYEILAIRMDLGPDFKEIFQSSREGFTDATQIARWFELNSRHFPEEFGWWWKEIEQEEG
ncbi:MAG: tetratricopeptide repeat protein [Promethearchaeia archaeon]